MAGTVLPLMTANSYWGMAVESTYGTAASISTMTPINSPKVTPGVKWLDDADFRGSPVAIYDKVAGVYMAQFDGKTYTYTDVYPNLLRAALGSNDSVASVGGGLYTHTIGLQNQPNTGSQPPSYTLISDSVDATYQMVASRLDSLNVSFAADAAVENTFSFKCNQPTVVASVSSTPSSTQHLIPAWNCSASIGGAAVYVVENWSLDIKRGTSQIYALGSESAVSNFCGPISVDGKCTFIVQQGETYWANALTRDQQVVAFTLTDPFTGYSIQYTMNTVQLTDPVINQGKNYVELDLGFTAVANTSNSVTFGYSPIVCTVTNNISTAY
jgi:hypothetical protein